MAAPDPTVVLVHGAAGGAWVWEKVGVELDRLGVAHQELDLPSVGDASPPDAGLAGDAAAVRALLDTLEAPVVLVGNSWGGAVISAAAVDHPAVARLVYVTAFMPVPDVTIVEQLESSEAFMGAMRFTDDGRGNLDPALAAGITLNQSTPEDAAHEIARSDWTRMSDVFEPMPAVAWTTIPSTYVVCTDDHAIPPAAERRWAEERATTVIERPWDHTPSSSHPAELAELLAGIAGEVTAG